jgi:4a-hydroxytetrahydrobiopterin dehydratase
MNLHTKKCVPCEGGTPPLTAEEIQEYLKEVEGWELRDSPSISLRINKTFKFKSFRESIDFVNRIASLAETENHHPDIHVRYKKVTLELTTHAIQGLSENDFIMASKSDLLYNLEEKLQRAVVSKLVSIKVLLVVVIILAGILFFTRF